MSGCGLRFGEAAAVAFDDVDFDTGPLHVRRQLKRLGKDHVYSLPKSDLARDVPLPDSVAMAVRAQLAARPPWMCTLPWEKPAGQPETHRLLFQWADGSYVRYRSYSEQVWKPALAKAGVVPPPVPDKRGRQRFDTSRKEGPHQLRHNYAPVMLVDGASIGDLAGFLGHRDPALTMRVYSHLQTGSHDRARKIIDASMFRLRSVGS